MHTRSAILGAGFMPDYACTAKCRHCLYGCSNVGSREYVTPEKADEIMKRLSSLGVSSLHVGGGEPFLNFEGLQAVLKSMRKYHIAVDYIETNAFWCVDQKATEEKLRVLLNLGADTIMASCDPFHIEYVPLKRVITFVEACEHVGIGYFIWKENFFRRLSRLDINRPHTVDELKEALGDDYILETAREYGVGMNGRALGIARRIYPLRKGDEAADPEPCTRMLMGHHCHIDLYGNVIPAGCTGISIPPETFSLHREELYDPEKYPVLSRLLTGGTEALLEFAVSRGFDPETNVATKCDLCYRIRCFLREQTQEQTQKQENSREAMQNIPTLQPRW